MSEATGKKSYRNHVLLLIAGIVLAALGVIFGTQQLLEFWLLAFVTVAGLAAGALGLLMIGHLLGGYWLNPVRDELEAAALTMPLLAILAIPIAFGLDQLFPWASEDTQLAIPALRAAYFERDFFLVRNAGYLVLWILLAFWVARPGEHRQRSAIGLALLTPTVTLAAIDWVMSRDPDWWSSLFGIVFAITQLLPALAGAVLSTLLRPHHPSRKRLRSLERALVTLALLILWLWFVQFLIIWMANLPHEVAWYIARYDVWGWLTPVAVVLMLVAGVLALLPPIVGGFLLRIGAGLLLLQHAVHMVWLVNPAAEGMFWPGLAALAALAAIWLLWLATGLKGRSNINYGRSA